MIENLHETLNYVVDVLSNASPEQVILTCSSAVITTAAYLGVKVTPRLGVAIGSGLYAAAHLAGWAMRKELSPACAAALEALDDESAVYEDRQDASGAIGVLACTGLSAVFRADGEVMSVRLPDSHLKDVLPGGKRGKEYRRVAAKAKARRDEVVERDRVAANSAAAQAVEEARARAAYATFEVEAAPSAVPQKQAPVYGWRQVPAPRKA